MSRCRDTAAEDRTDQVFEKWIARQGKSHGVSTQALSALAPYAGLPMPDLASALPEVTRVGVKAGLIQDELPADRQVFLEKGSIQIQTHTGYVLPLQADSALARYPVPLKPTVVSLYAAEPSSFLCVPEALGASAQGTQVTTLARPELLPEEAEALEQLRAYFRKEHCELPSLPDLALKIGKAINDPNNKNADIARLIQLDPSLSARLISVVNSAAFGGLNKITSINQAAARLGRRKLRSLVYSCLLKGIFKINSKTLKRRMEELWHHSVDVAALSYVLGRETPGIDAEQALLAGLIHDIGTLAAIGGVNRFPVLANRAAVLDYTLESLRIELGLVTLRQWGLHREFADVIRDAENWRRTGWAVPQNADVVVLAQLHASVGTPRQSQLPRIDSVPAFGKLAGGELTPSHSLALLEAADAEVREVRALLGAA